MVSLARMEVMFEDRHRSWRQWLVYEVDVKIVATSTDDGSVIVRVVGFVAMSGDTIARVSARI